MRYIKCVALLIAFSCIFTSCSNEENDVKIQVSDNNKTFSILMSKKYDNTELESIIQFQGDMEKLDELYPLECVREVGENYRISFLGDDRVAIIICDQNGEKIVGNIFNLSCVKSDFSDLKTGQSLRDVQKIDPKGEYMFLYTGRNDSPKISTHYTKDGYLITVEYDDNNIIVSVAIELI